jgi:hypothetical protein
MMLGYDQDHDIRVTGQQLLLPEFRFDEMARATTKESLLSELPVRIVDKYKRGVAFEQFFADITNETPATKTIINDALAQLNAEGVIEIRDKTGLTKRESGTQHRSDVLKPSEQTKFPFWR